VFQQLYTFHIKVDGQFIPVAMAMLPGKTENTYTRLFQELVAAATGIQRQLRPQVVHTDVEMAAVSALYNVLGVHSTGCLFHFTQCIYRKVTELGMKMEYHTDNPKERVSG
jgi:MULE transposase domain